MRTALKTNDVSLGTIKMPNNLDFMIRKSGLLRKEIAERKGIRPETVSRHISGALNFSLKDAEQYAAILDCTAQDILFAQNAVPLFGKLDESHVTVSDPTEGEIAYHVTFPVDENRRFVIANHKAQKKKWANGRLYLFDNKPILAQSVDDSCFMRLCILKIANDKQIRFGVVYPEPGGTFSIGFNSDSHSSTEQSNVPNVAHSEIQSGLTLNWCTPILSCIMQPDLLGIVLKEQV